MHDIARETEMNKIVSQMICVQLWRIFNSKNYSARLNIFTV